MAAATGSESAQMSGAQETPDQSGKSKVAESASGEAKASINKPICRFYANNKRCRFGYNCRFAHVGSNLNKPQKTTDGEVLGNTESFERMKLVENVSSTDEQKNIKTTEGTQAEKRNARKKLCRFFKNGNCSFGDRCRFWHPSDLMDPSTPYTATDIQNNDDIKHEKGNQVKTNATVQPKPQRQVMKPNVMQRYSLSQLGSNDLLDLRDTEIQQLKKRYPDATAFTEGPDDCFDFVFKPTDPDWPFDVSQLTLTAAFSKEYPLKALDVTVPAEEDIPLVLQKNLEKRISEWINTRFDALMNEDKVELMFRPFLKWLDKQLEDIFADGLRQYKRELVAQAAGVEFVPASQLQEQYKSQATSESEEESGHSSYEESDDEDDDDDGKSDSHIGAGSDTQQSDEESAEEEEEKGPVIDPVKRGTEIKLKHLQLKENAATLQATKVTVTIQCDRCKNRTDVSTPADRLNSVMCCRCSSEQFVSFRSAMVHQFSSTLGYLDLVDCTAFDVILLDCKFNVGCLSCNRQAVMEGLVPGQMKDLWCHHCHGKQSYATEGVRFQQLQPAGDVGKQDAGKAHVVSVKRQRRVVKDPAIQEGKPLPDNGVCKHYRKSFRWFRFPCCGKTYPCDICHDMNEMDHEMKYANRVICGYCCREQPFSAEQPCRGCGSSMTKKGSAHWEGGKGCRDKSKMSKNDSQKYSSTNKTVSRKAQEKQKTKGQKSKGNKSK